jgi:hypothetical protein
MAARTNGAGTPGATKSSNFAIDVSKYLMLGAEHHLTSRIAIDNDPSDSQIGLYATNCCPHAAVVVACFREAGANIFRKTDSVGS